MKWILVIILIFCSSFVFAFDTDYCQGKSFEDYNCNIDMDQDDSGLLKCFCNTTLMFCNIDNYCKNHAPYEYFIFKDNGQFFNRSCNESCVINYSDYISGCINDSDCDSVADHYDKCPDSKGIVDDRGCDCEQIKPGSGTDNCCVQCENVLVDDDPTNMYFALKCVKWGSLACDNSKPEGYDDYTSIYSLGFDVNYVDRSKRLHSEKYYNFKDLYNLNDSRVLCSSPVPGSCGPIPETFQLPLIDNDFSNKQFRIYVPPGTYKIDTMFYTYRDDTIALAVRYGSPLTGDYSDLDEEDASSITWLGPSAYRKLEDYTGKDVLRENSGGAITILSGGIGEVVKKGGWFYFKVLDFGTGAHLTGIKSFIYFHTDAYIDWYNNTQWDENGDPYDFCNGNMLDNDGDGITDTEDNCLGLRNPEQYDSDGDNVGNACRGTGSQIREPSENSTTDPVERCDGIGVTAIFSPVPYETGPQGKGTWTYVNKDRNNEPLGTCEWTCLEGYKPVRSGNYYECVEGTCDVPTVEGWTCNPTGTVSLSKKVDCYHKDGKAYIEDAYCSSSGNWVYDIQSCAKYHVGMSSNTYQTYYDYNIHKCCFTCQTCRNAGFSGNININNRCGGIINCANC